MTDMTDITHIARHPGHPGDGTSHLRRPVSILGAGHIGFAIALLLQQTGDYDILVADRDPIPLTQLPPPRAPRARSRGAVHIGFAIALLLQQTGDYDILVADRDPMRLAKVAALGIATRQTAADADWSAVIDGRFAVL